MLQQTQVQTVIPYFKRFVGKFPDILTLAGADLHDVLKSWEKMGYYARARNLHAAARELERTHGCRVPRDYETFRRLPGVGDYIAAAVMSIAFGTPVAAIDSNVRRVLSRTCLIDAPTNRGSSARVFREHAERLFDTRRPGDYNQAVMEFGATVCRPRRPLCGQCPVTDLCQAFLTGRQSDFPVRKKKPPVPTQHIAVGIVRKGHRILITRRKPEGLLGGLWEFPGGKVRTGERPEAACRREIKEETNLAVQVTGHLTHVDHAYSHLKVGLDVYSCAYVAGDIRLHGPDDFRWILVDEIDDYAFPGANHKFLPLVKEGLDPTDSIDRDADRDDR